MAERSGRWSSKSQTISFKAFFPVLAVYIPDEWEFPREKIKLVRELGNGSFGMVYEGEAEDITPNAPRCTVAVKVTLLPASQMSLVINGLGYSRRIR